MEEDLIYKEDSIKTLDSVNHLRKRFGLYIGKGGDGSSYDDGIYVLIKEVIDNSIDEYIMGYGNNIEITILNNQVKVRDYGRGIPLGKVVDCVSKINTGAKYGGEAFKRTVGLNGVGTKAVNALSKSFEVYSIRDKQEKSAKFKEGILQEENLEKTNKPNGTEIIFIPDGSIFKGFKFREEYVKELLWNYAYLNKGLKLIYNGEVIESKDGLKDLLKNKIDSKVLYPIVHISNEDMEIAFTHNNFKQSDEIYSFVNGQYTVQGGAHQNAFREIFIKSIRDVYKKQFDASDITNYLVAAISVKILDPVFESQTKSKLGSSYMEPDGVSIRNYLDKHIGPKITEFLLKNKQINEILLNKIKQSEKDRKDLLNIKKINKEKFSKLNIHNKKLRDCKIHYNTNHPRKDDTMIFLTEGDSASGSITKARDVNIQAVFSLTGKPKNSFKMSKKDVYINDTYKLLINALGLDNGLGNLRYSKVILASDSDVDGQHICMLLTSFFLKHFPELIQGGHLHLLETPLYRVRNKKETIYCNNEKEKNKAIEKLKGNVEVLYIKGLGEISPNEFAQFINKKSIKLIPITISPEDNIGEILEFYMSGNTEERRDFIVNNLKQKETSEEIQFSEISAYV